MTDTRFRRVALVVNDAARTAGAERELLGDRLARFVEVIDIGGSTPAETTQAVTEHRDQVDLVVAAGGDGTLHYVARGLVGGSTPLAVVPLGTANDFARSLELPLDLEQAVEVALAGDAARIDVGCANGVTYLNAAGVGVIEDITEELSTENKKLLGPLAYVYAAARTTFAADPFDLDLEIDGVRQSRSLLQILVGNGRYFGPALEVAPDAGLEDGLLHLCFVEPSPPRELVAAGLHLWRGDHDQAAALEVISARQVRITTAEPRAVFADGECIGETPTTIGVIRGGLLVQVPRRPESV